MEIQYFVRLSSNNFDIENEITFEEYDKFIEIYTYKNSEVKCYLYWLAYKHLNLESNFEKSIKLDWWEEFIYYSVSISLYLKD